MMSKSMWMGLVAMTVMPAVQAQQGVEAHLIVKYKNSFKSIVSMSSRIQNSTGMQVQQFQPMANGAYTLILTNPKRPQGIKAGVDITDYVIDQLKKNPDVLYAVEDRVGHFKPVPNPIHQDIQAVLGHETQWDEFAAPAGIRLESAAGKRDGAWAYTTGLASKPVVVAILDTGIEPNPNLINNIVKDKNGKLFGWNFAGKNSQIQDETDGYHGTHVAGTVAAYGAVITGMGENLKILPVKIPDGSGMFYESQVINGMIWSVGGEVPNTPTNPYKASVLNMSFGVDERPGKEKDHCDAALQDALDFVKKNGAVAVVAAGNDNHWEHFNAPAVCEGVIRVASTGPQGLRSYFSNYGPTVTVAAPGGDKRYGDAGGILSTVNIGGGYMNSGFDFYQGTSMASPHVAGVVGLLYAITDHKITPDQVARILSTTAHEFGKSNDMNKSCVGRKPCGHGILDAEAAVKAAVSHYKIMMNSPAATDLELKDCGPRQKTADKADVLAQDVLWHRVGDGLCQDEESYLSPVITASAGEIYANYGEARYKLDQSAYNLCMVVGRDGVACY